MGPSGPEESFLSSFLTQTLKKIEEFIAL